MRDVIDDDGYENLAEALLPNWHEELVQATYKYEDEALQVGELWEFAEKFIKGYLNIGYFVGFVGKWK